jgi:hypothetical protein
VTVISTSSKWTAACAVLAEEDSWTGWNELRSDDEVATAGSIIAMTSGVECIRWGSFSSTWHSMQLMYGARSL